MKLTKVLSLLMAILTLSPAVACTSRSNNAINSRSGNDSVPGVVASRSTPEATTSAKNHQPAKTAQTNIQPQKSSTKTDTISVEGQKTEITLKRYDQASEVFTTL